MKPKNIILLLLAAVSFFMGVASQYFYPGVDLPRSDVAFILIGVFLVFYWYHLDSVEQRYRRSIFLNIGVILISLIALPYYFFRSRGAKRGFIATGWYLLAAIASSLLTAAGAYTVYYGFQS